MMNMKLVYVKSFLLRSTWSSMVLTMHATMAKIERPIRTDKPILVLSSIFRSLSMRYGRMVNARSVREFHAAKY